MCQGDFAGPGRAATAPDQASVRDSVVRSAKGALMKQSGAFPENAGDAVDLGGFDGLFKGQGREDARETLGQHGLAGTGWPDHQYVVASGRGHLKSAFGGSLAANICKIGSGGFGGLGASQLGDGSREVRGGFQKVDGFGEMANAKDVDAFDYGGFGGVFQREDEVLHAVAAGANRNGKRPADGADGAIEREFAHGKVAVAIWGETLRAEDAESHGQIETGAFLTHVGGGKIDGDGLVGVSEAGVKKGGFDPLAAFSDGGIGHADQSEIFGHAGFVQVHFDIDGVGVNAVNRRAASFEKSHEDRCKLKRVSLQGNVSARLNWGSGGMADTADSKSAGVHSP